MHLATGEPNRTFIRRCSWALPLLTFTHLPRRSPHSAAARRFAHIVKYARIWRPLGLAPQPQPHFIRGPVVGHV
jgi:hypothetical protein